MIWGDVSLRKVLAPIKIKSALPLPPKKPKISPPPPKTRNFTDIAFSCRKNAFFPGAHKIGAAISNPRIAGRNFTDTRIFLNRDLDATSLILADKKKLSTTTTALQFLADLAKAMVDMMFLCIFQDLGIDRGVGDPELDFALGRWW